MQHSSCYALASVTLLVLTAASAAAPEPLEDPIPQPIGQGQVLLELEPVADGLTAPNFGTSVPGCLNLQDRLVVTDQPGILWAVDVITGEKQVLLDVSDRLVSLGVAGPGTFDERGLLGVALHPDFASNGHLYTYISEPVDGPADFSTMPPETEPNHQSVVHEWQVPEPCDAASVVDPDTARELLRIDEPQFNHNAGALNFGPDGMLYIALGDGGAADDQGVGHVPGGNGQEPENILGTIIRIDPDGSDSANGQYGIPVGNPFAGEAGALDEIFAYGFRNPFRFSFDEHTGEMLIADAGQNDIEEISVGVAGGNYGWRLKEGSFCFDPNGDDPGFVFHCRPGDAPGDLIDPIAEYDHDEGLVIIGGFVYRGAQIPSLFGRYVFGDYFSPAVGSGRLFYLQKNDRILEFPLAARDTLGRFLLGFAQDGFGELYVLGNETGVPFGDTGSILKLASGRGAANQRFRAHLDGRAEVPPVGTRARGQAIFSFEESLALNFRLQVAQLEDVVAAHIHCGVKGVNGPVGVTLFEGDPVSVNGELVQDTATAPDTANGCGWTDLNDVRAAMQFGLTYVNVHTLAHPAGEIRGQIR